MESGRIAKEGDWKDQGMGGYLGGLFLRDLRYFFFSFIFLSFRRWAFALARYSLVNFPGEKEGGGKEKVCSHSMDGAWFGFFVLS